MALSKDFITFPDVAPENDPNPAPLPDMYAPPAPRPPFHPHRPAFTVQEEFIETTRRVNETLNRVLRMEEMIRHTLDQYTATITADNVAFKNLTITTYNTFATAVHDEVNTFEADILNSYKALEAEYKADLADFEKRYDTHTKNLNDALQNFIVSTNNRIGIFETSITEAMNAYKAELNQTYDDFRDAIESRLEMHNAACEQSFNDYVATTNKKLSDMEARFNRDYATFVAQTNQHIAAFENEWTGEIEARLDGQDAMINDAVLYFKTNFEATVTNIVNEMVDNGEFIDIVENSLFPDLTKKIDVVAGSYVYVDEIEGFVKYETLAEAQADTTNLNAEKLIEYITDGARLMFGAGFYPMNQTLDVFPNMEITSDSATLVFNNTRGIVFHSPRYYGNMNIHDIAIHAKSHCIDFMNEGGDTRPYNVYFSKFANLELYSVNGSCLYAGDVTGMSGDQLVFSTTFRNIKVGAPNGYGVYGIGGLGILFEEISDRYYCKAVFNNCFGTWQNCNTSFAGSGYFLRIDSKARTNYGAYIIMRNVNMEEVTEGGIFVDRNSDFAHERIILENVGVVLNPEAEKQYSETDHDSLAGAIEYPVKLPHPLTFGATANTLIDIKGVKIKMINSNADNNVMTWTQALDGIPESDISLYELPHGTMTVNDNIAVYCRQYKKVINLNTVSYNKSLNSANTYLDRYAHHKELQADYFHGARGRVPYTLNLSDVTAASVNCVIPVNTHPDGLILTGATKSIELSSILLQPYNGNDNGKIFYVRNDCDYDITVGREAQNFQFISADESTTKVTFAPHSVTYFAYMYDEEYKRHYFTEINNVAFKVVAVKNLKLTANTAEGITITWDAAEGATNYRVRRHDGNTWENYEETTETTFTDNNVISGTEYKYAVYLYDGAKWFGDATTVTVTAV